MNLNNWRDEYCHIVRWVINRIETPCAKLLEDIINKGNQVSFRTRGSGELIPREDDTFEVKDYTLISIDYTSDPA